MSLENLISIERVEFEETRERIQETFFVTDLTLLKLFREVLKEVKIDILPILNMKILLYALNSVPLTEELEFVLESLNHCMEYQLYGESDKWSCNTIATKIQELRNAILYDYSIEGSLNLYSDYHVKWNLEVSFIS